MVAGAFLAFLARLAGLPAVGFAADLGVVDLGAAFLTTALDFGLRKRAGQSNVQAGLGSGSSLAGATGGGALGMKIGAALGTLIAPGVGTVVGGALGGTIFSILF